MAKFVHRCMDVQVFLAAFFPVAISGPYIIIKDFGTTIEADRGQPQTSAAGSLEQRAGLFCQMLDLNGGQCLDGNVRKAAFAAENMDS